MRALLGQRHKVTVISNVDFFHFVPSNPWAAERVMTLTVTYQGGTRFTVSNGRHAVVADQPVEDGGTDTGLSPLELFVGSLASCVGYFVARFCARRGLAADGFTVEAEWELAEGPHRVGAVRLTVRLPGALAPEDQVRLLKVARGCTVHQSLAVPPEVEIRLIAPAPGMPAARARGTPSPRRT
ncbi:OsmC family protein [Nitrospira sp. Kam-Ns4a]